MKKVIPFLLLILISCSTEEKEDTEAMCCEHPISELVAHYRETYSTILQNENLSSEQRRLIAAEYEKAIEDPCGVFQKELEAAGASCNGPH